MILIRLFLSVLLIISASGQRSCLGWREIKSGDTCWKILTENRHLNENSLKNLNPGLNCDKLIVGDKICVLRSPFPFPNPCRRSVKIQPGDTCFKIWTSAQISERQFKAWNENVNCDNLGIGKSVCVER